MKILLIICALWSLIQSHPIQTKNSTHLSFFKQEIDAIEQLLLSIVHCEKNYCNICSHVEIDMISLNETS